jgi:hypothetical protein
MRADFEDVEWASQAFLAACSHGDAHMLATLTKRGCHPARFPDVALKEFERLCSDDLAYSEPASIEGHVGCVRIIAQCGVPIEGSPNGPTPLMRALSAGCVPTAVALLELGADPLARRGKQGVAALAKDFMNDPEFARGYAAMIARQEQAELSAQLAGDSIEGKKMRAGL